MKRRTNAVRFNLKEVNANRRTPIFLIFRYSYKGKNVKLKFSTGESVHPKFWDSSRCRIKTNLMSSTDDHVAINEKLSRFEEVTLAIYREKSGMSFQQFKDQILLRMGYTDDNPSPTLKEFFRIRLEELEKAKGRNHRTTKNFRTICNHFDSVCDYIGEEVDYDDFDYNFIEAYKNWWFAKGGNNSINTISNYFSKMKATLKQAHKKGYHSNDIYEQKDFSIKGVKTEKKVVLTLAELNALIDLELEEGSTFDVVRDITVAAIHCGLRVSDYQKINLDSIKTHKDHKYIEIPTQKIAGKVVAIPVLPILENLLKKYDGTLPTFAQQHINTEIKKILRMIIPDSSYTWVRSENNRRIAEKRFKHQDFATHDCRRTFATIFYKMGVPVFSLMQILGHSTEKQFFDYIDLSVEDSLDAFFDVVDSRE
ncbi:MAG: site-specific integrase [Bacteroidota bacterium]